jgi:hypothetical protein
MSIDLSNVEKGFKENVGYWYNWPDDDDIKIKIRPMFPDKGDELQKRCIIMNELGNKELDQDKLAKLTFEYVVEDWQGIIFNGSEDCTNEAKIMIGKYHEKLLKFVLNKSKEIARIIANDNEEQIKNLKSLLGPPLKVQN